MTLLENKFFVLQHSDTTVLIVSDAVRALKDLLRVHLMLSVLTTIKLSKSV